MSLFTSEIVKKEMEHAYRLYTEVSIQLPTIASASKEEKLEVIDKMNRLIDIQEILYTRINLLEDDEDANQMKENFRLAAKQMGLPPIQINASLFNKAREAIESMKNSREFGLVDTD
jgi:hypothetical protein|tara:strand:+ start:1585 stop:1935 length:351 start_codon:yes stop_codon:yes gene_type:complete